MKKMKVGDVRRLKTSSGYQDVVIKKIEKKSSSCQVVTWESQNGIGVCVASAFDEPSRFDFHVRGARR